MKYRILFFFLCILMHSHVLSAVVPDTLWTKGILTSNFSFVEREIKLDSLERRYQKHGYLRDNCIEFTDLDCFNKKLICDSNCVTRDIFPNLLRSVSTMNSSGSNWNVEDVLSAQSSENAPNNCSISIIQYLYIQLKESALDEGLVKLDGDYVKDVFKDGVHLNPYIDGVLFAFSPSDTLFYNQLTFSFPSNIYKSNISSQIEFDADDGTGFHSLSSGSTISVKYQSGRHHLKMRIQLGSDTYYAHCFINTISEPTQTRSSDEYKIETIFVGGKRAYLTRRNALDNRPTQPFLFVEGFDPELPGNAKKDEFKYGDMGYSDVLESVDYKDLTKKFDVYYLDFKDCTLSIKENALLFEEAIKK